MKFAYMIGTLTSMFFALFSMYYKDSYARTLKPKFKKLFRLFAFLSFIPLTFISAVRYNIGTDYLSYQYIFSLNADPIISMERGFKYLIRGIRKISTDPRLCFAVISTIIGALNYWFIYKESENPMFSILLYVLTRDYFCSMNSIRQFTAMSIMLLAIPLIRKGGWRWIFVFIITGIAFTFHISVIAAIPLYLLFLLNPAPWLSGFIVMAAYLIPTYGMQYLQVLTERYLPHYTMYLVGLEPAFESSTFLTFLCLFGYVMVMVKTFDKYDNKSRLFYNAMIYGMAALALAAGTHFAAIRFSYFANPYIIAYLPHIVNKVQKRWLRIVSYILIFIAFFITCNFVTLSGNQSVLGYKTIWNV